MLRAFGHPVATCCDMLGHDGCCWLKFDNGQIFHATFADVAWCWSRLARFVHQCCAQACVLVRFSILNMSQHVATGWPNARNMLCPTMLRNVASKCCYRLGGACKYWANNVAICCIEMLRSFGRGLICKIAAELITTQLGVLKKPETNPFVCLHFPHTNRGKVGHCSCFCSLQDDVAVDLSTIQRHGVAKVIAHASCVRTLRMRFAAL